MDWLAGSPQKLILSSTSVCEIHGAHNFPELVAFIWLPLHNFDPCFNEFFFNKFKSSQNGWMWLDDSIRPHDTHSQLFVYIHFFPRNTVKGGVLEPWFGTNIRRHKQFDITQMLCQRAN
ncbi:hypothetical protein OGAPHI_000877 [Ogataea philodendri]|uniref:Uncharacterized protein n=1 Tax=Ogataea philodendri TaxID=1378263 RepID=A0A9P8TAJ7_9ASCO|nr:uncharacterized protein OGAPHI_000877 [Ogataea philodendri]KAH3671166.1 hypothetical protein OGAPHI_000877 [Ogataea philodendri]